MDWTDLLQQLAQHANTIVDAVLATLAADALKKLVSRVKNKSVPVPWRAPPRLPGAQDQDERD